MVQWSGLGALTEAGQWVGAGGAQDRFLVVELRSHKPCGAAPNPNKQQKKKKTKYDTQIKSHALGILAERFQKDLREVGRDLNILLLMDQPGT